MHFRLCLSSLVLVALSTVRTPAQATASALIAQAQQTARATHTLQAEITLTRTAGGKTLTTSGTILLARPNYALIRLTGDDPPRLLQSDGRNLYTLAPDRTYTEVSSASNGANFAEPWFGLTYRFFFTQSLNPFGAQPDSTVKWTVLPNETIDGATYRVLQGAGESPMSYSARFYIDSNNILARSIVNFGDPKHPNASFESHLSHVKRNLAATPATFRFTPPPNTTRKEGQLSDAMLALGETAPPFDLPAPDGSRVSLAHRQAKATLVNFWYLDCPPCRIEFPDFQKLYAQLHAKGLDIIAIDKADKPQDVANYMRKAGLTFPVALGGEPTEKSVFAQYRVTNLFPGTYLLDSDGRIVYRAAGDDPKGLREALARLGLTP